MTWIWRCVSSRWARRIYLAVLLVLLATTIALRAYVFVLTERAQAVLAGLAQLRFDETTEAELLRTVPYLVRGEREAPIGFSVQRFYSAVISNEDGYLSLARFGSGPYPDRWWGLTLAEWLGYRYFRFDAQVIVLDGRVSLVRYGVSKEAVWPVWASYLVSVRSFHGLWAPHQTGFAVTSVEDESPQYRVLGDDKSLQVSFAYDAPPDVKARVFQLKLACFWGLFGCRNPRQVAPGMWQDKVSTETKVLSRLRSSEPCPDRILAGRVRYLLDVQVIRLRALAESRSQTKENSANRSSKHGYEVVEVLRGRDRKGRVELGDRPAIPSPVNPRDTMENPVANIALLGNQVLWFANHRFESCYVIGATPSAEAAVRRAIQAPWRHEDIRVTGLL